MSDALNADRIGTGTNGGQAMSATDTPGSIPEPTHPATLGKPCPGGGTCCNRSEFDRALYPCSQVDQLRALLAAERRRAEAAEEHAVMAALLAEEQIAARKDVEKKLAQERTYANDLDGCLQSIAMEVTGSPETAGIVCKIEELVKSRAAADKRVSELESQHVLTRKLAAFLEKYANDPEGTKKEFAAFGCVDVPWLNDLRARIEADRDKWHKLCQDQCEVETAIRTMLEPIIGRDLAFGTSDGQEPLEDAVRAALDRIAAAAEEQVSELTEELRRAVIECPGGDACLGGNPGGVNDR